MHTAVTHGRVDNVAVLLHTAKEKAESNEADDQIIYEKFGLASINQLNKSRQSPLHLAILNDHLVSDYIFFIKNNEIEYFVFL